MAKDMRVWALSCGAAACIVRAACRSVIAYTDMSAMYMHNMYMYM